MCFDLWFSLQNWCSHRNDCCSCPTTVDIVHPNRPISQIPECTCAISHNATFCNRNVHTCAHFCYKMLHCGIFVWCIVGFVRLVYWVAQSRTACIYQLTTLNCHRCYLTNWNLIDVSCLWYVAVNMMGPEAFILTLINILWFNISTWLEFLGRWYARHLMSCIDINWFSSVLRLQLISSE